METVREMTFEEEAILYEKEARAEFAKENGNSDSEGVNNKLRRGMRIIRKARELINGKEPKTNGDRTRAMSDEELARWLDYEFGRCEWCNPDNIGTEDCSDVDCTGCIVKWLKQPVGANHV